MDRMQSLHNDYTLNYVVTSEGETEPLTVTADFAGGVDATLFDPQNADFFISETQTVTYPGSGTISTANEIIKVGALYWTRAGNDERWFESPVYDGFNNDYRPYHRGAFVLREVATAQWLSDQAGHASYTVDIYDFPDLPPFRGRRSLFGPGDMEGVDLRGTISGEVWLDPTTLYVLRQTLMLDADVTVQGQSSHIVLTYDVSVSQHDAVAPIEPPSPDQIER
ncbi:MAG: hypothetical protein M5R40_17815 [Anaerolineae bacterium]|nr:hypothetical protein [Anaerolineae bacterium]